MLFNKHFSDNLAIENGSTIFLQLINKEEIANIISFPNSNKAAGPNNIPNSILFLPKNEILKQLTELFNLFLKYSITVSGAESWNKIQKQLTNTLL